jgi:nitrate/nitrite transport system ATP-binding protein
MITHDVDEAIYLSDRVLVMSDGPNATIAESVTIDLPRPRARSELLPMARYHELRAHLLGFLTQGARAKNDLDVTQPEPAPLALESALESGE